MSWRIPDNSIPKDELVKRALAERKVSKWIPRHPAWGAVGAALWLPLTGGFLELLGLTSLLFEFASIVLGFLLFGWWLLALQRSEQFSDEMLAARDLGGWVRYLPFYFPAIVLGFSLALIGFLDGTGDHLVLRTILIYAAVGVLVAGAFAWACWVSSTAVKRACDARIKAMLVQTAVTRGEAWLWERPRR